MTQLQPPVHPMPSSSLRAPWRARLAHGYEVGVWRGVHGSGWGVESMFHFQALDRPDRIEMRLVSTQANLASDAELGGRVTLDRNGSPRFRGVVESVTGGFDARRGAWLNIVAYAGYHRRRQLPPVRYYQLTDSELAQRLAVALQLVPIVDPTTTVRRCVEVSGDPLSALRQVAAVCAFELAVTDSKLFFVRSLPRTSHVAVVDFRTEVASLEWTCRRDDLVRGNLRFVGERDWRPLSHFRLHGLPRRDDRIWRVERVMHFLDREGYRTHLEFGSPSPPPSSTGV